MSADIRLAVTVIGVGGRSLTKLRASCDSRVSMVRTRQDEFTSGRKDKMSSSVTAALTCRGGRIMAAGRFGIQRPKSSWRTQREEGQTAVPDEAFRTAQVSEHSASLDGSKTCRRKCFSWFHSAQCDDVRRSRWT